MYRRNGSLNSFEFYLDRLLGITTFTKIIKITKCHVLFYVPLYYLDIILKHNYPVSYKAVLYPEVSNLPKR